MFFTFVLKCFLNVFWRCSDSIRDLSFGTEEVLNNKFSWYRGVAYLETVAEVETLLLLRLRHLNIFALETFTKKVRKHNHSISIERNFCINNIITKLWSICLSVHVSRDVERAQQNCVFSWVLNFCILGKLTWFSSKLSCFIVSQKSFSQC